MQCFLNRMPSPTSGIRGAFDDVGRMRDDFVSVERDRMPVYSKAMVPSRYRRLVCSIAHAGVWQG